MKEAQKSRKRIFVIYYTHIPIKMQRIIEVQITSNRNDGVMDILAKIRQLRLENGWSEYELAERADLPQSTISTWYRKNLIPSIPSLEHICNAFGITLSQFFLDSECFSEKITKEQIEILKRWNKLTKEQQQKLADFLDSML